MKIINVIFNLQLNSLKQNMSIRKTKQNNTYLTVMFFLKEIEMKFQNQNNIAIFVTFSNQKGAPPPTPL